MDGRFALHVRLVHLRRTDEDAVGAQIEWRHGRAVGDDQLGFAVDAAVEIRVGGAGQHVGARIVARHHRECVVRAEADLVGDFECERRGASAVLAHVVAVHEEVGDVLHAVEPDEEPFRGPLLGDEEVVLVVGRGLQEESAPSRVGIPGVRQRDLPCVVAAVLRFEKEPPTFVQRIDFARRCGEAGKEQQQRDDLFFHDAEYFVCLQAKIIQRRFKIKFRAGGLCSRGRPKWLEFRFLCAVPENF